MSEALDPVVEELPGTEFLSTNLDVASRTLYVGDIEDGAASLFLKSLHVLLVHSSEPVHIMLNSKGGDLLDAFGMYDAIRTASTTVTCEVFGHCMSAGVLIAQACDRRLIHENALVMIHNPSHVLEGDSYSTETWGKWAGVIRKKLFRILAKHTEKPIAFWERRCARGDRLYDAQSAVDVGLFDSIIEHDE